MHRVDVIKASGQKEPFDEDKLRASLLNSGASSELADKVVAHVLPEIHDDMTTDEIYRHSFHILKDMSRPAARRYSLRRAVMDLGPSGFPFEDFLAEILKTKGFETKTRETLLGGCVPHEVDVVAWNPKKLIIVEAKFHNELGNKSDLKVALYMKARFDDLHENVYDYGGNDRAVTDSWLVTNTKFSSTAIHYAVCKNLTIIGWSYPEKGNLADMIEEEGLHPLTCLTTLSKGDKDLLLANSVVLCSTLRDNPGVLREVLGHEFNDKPVIDEVSELYA